MIRSLVSGARYTKNFDDLPIPFRAVATVLISGDMVILDSGDLAIAMRASMAIPGAFAPVQIDDMVLADGGMMRNLPVDVVRDLCADIVIAVWLTTTPPDSNALSSPIALVGRSLDVIIVANERAQIASLTETDVGIDVAMGDMASSDFMRAPDAIALGRGAAEASRTALQRLAVSEEQYAAWLESTRRSNTNAGSVSEVRIAGLQRVNPAYVLSRVDDIAPGDDVNVEEVAERVFALGDFEHVGYRVSGPVDAQVLEINAIEKSWGPNFLRFDLGIAADGDNDILAILRADHYLTWVNRRGGTWHNVLQIGQQALVTTDFYQPLDVRQRFFVQPAAVYMNELEDVYLDGQRIARYYFQQVYGQLDAGMNFGTRAQARVGLRSGWRDIDLDTGIPGLPELHHERDTTLRFHFAYDTRNSIGLPTKGAFLNTRYVSSRDWFGSESDYELVEGVYAPSFNIGGNSLSLIFGGGTTLSGDPPATEVFQLGGIRTFPGLRPGELRGNDYWYAGSSYSWRLNDLQPLVGIAGTLGGRTPVGPFLISLGYVDNDSLRLQFTIGRPVDEGSILDAVD